MVDARSTALLSIASGPLTPETPLYERVNRAVAMGVQEEVLPLLDVTLPEDLKTSKINEITQKIMDEVIDAFLNATLVDRMRRAIDESSLILEEATVCRVCSHTEDRHTHSLPEEGYEEYCTACGSGVEYHDYNASSSQPHDVCACGLERQHHTDDGVLHAFFMEVPA